VTIPARRALTGPAVLRWALTSLVVTVTAGAAGAVALLLGRAIGLVDDWPSTWSLVATAAVVAIVAAAMWRRVDAAVVDLVFGVDDQQIAAIASIEHDLASELGGAQYLADLAAIAQTLLRVPFVTADIRSVAAEHGAGRHPAPEPSAWSSQLTATAGTVVTARSLGRPVRLGSEDLGTITVGCRSRGRGFSADDVAAVDAIGRQAALVISNARHAEALHASRERAVAGIEEERRRLRRNLHDELGPTLAAMKLRLGVLRRTGRLVAEDLRVVDELSAMVDGTTADVRRLVEDLRPPLLDDLGLGDALRCLGFVPPELALSVEGCGGLEHLPAAVQVALYRIGSEAIRNVVCHAGATTCDVRLRHNETAVTMTVVDDGQGIDDDRTDGAGLAAMRERADELGGLVTVSRGVDGRGCCVAATIPLRSGVARSASTSPTKELG
jgi:two-component system NarL family sensor kinase